MNRFQSDLPPPAQAPSLSAGDSPTLESHDPEFSGH